MKISILLCMFLAVSVSAADTSPRHNQGGTIGPNGVRQRVAIKINKTKTGRDLTSIQLDLGEHKYDGRKPDALITERPIIIIQLGTSLAYQGQCNPKAKIISANFTAKLVSNGKGIQFDLKKQDLSLLLSELSGLGEHVHMTITVKDDHPPAPPATLGENAEPRHAHSLYENEFELDIEENTKVLVARG